MGIILIYRKADYHSEDFKTLNGKSVSQGKDLESGTTKILKEVI